MHVTYSAHVRAWETVNLRLAMAKEGILLWHGVHDVDTSLAHVGKRCSELMYRHRCLHRLGRCVCVCAPVCVCLNLAFPGFALRGLDTPKSQNLSP